MILGGGPQHRRPADVDLLDCLVEGRAGSGNGLTEGIEVDDDQVDRADAVLGERGNMGRYLASGKDARVDDRVQRLHASVEHLGKVGELLDRRDRNAAGGEQRSCATGGNDLDITRNECSGELDDAGLVTHADERAMDCLVLDHVAPVSSARIAGCGTARVAGCGMAVVAGCDTARIAGSSAAMVAGSNSCSTA